jgi:dihydroorotate dehydrogenase (fumarate)
MTVDLRTRYLGMSLKNPFVAAACPLTGDLTRLRRLEEAGVAAAVLPSLFQEQIEREDEELFPPEDAEECETIATGVVPDLLDYNAGPDSYLRLVELAKRSVTIPVIASLNGTHPGSWTRFAKSMCAAGADALELNVCFIPSDPAISGQMVEDRVVDLVATVRDGLSIPLAVKIGPYFTALPHLAQRLVAAGANGLVLFNRFLEPDIDLESFRTKAQIELSTSHELRLPLRWIAILHDQVPISLAAVSGIHSATDAIKAILSGADVVMTASALYRNGVGYVQAMKDELIQWMEDHQFASLDDIRGNMSFSRCRDPSAIERANYLRFIMSLPADSSARP